MANRAQLTQERSRLRREELLAAAIDLFADNVQFSVLIGGECIIGQDGNVGYQSTVLPVLSSGSCLVGKTRPITW